MKIPPKEFGGLKRPADSDEKLRDEQSVRRPRLEKSPSVGKKNDEDTSDRTSRPEDISGQIRPAISISLAGVQRPRSTGIIVARPNAFANMAQSTASSSRRKEKAPSPERGRVLSSGPNPLKNPPFWKKQSLTDHASRHLLDTGSKDEATYKKTSLELLNAPVTGDKPAYVRVHGLPDGSREAGDVARHDTNKRTIAVAKSTGEVRTYHGQQSSGLGRQGLLSEGADDFARGLNQNEKKR